MSRSPLHSIFGVLNKLQQKFYSTASSSRPFDVPKLNRLNDMVYEVHSPPDPELEVVFFHGLQGRHSENACVTTWMSRDNSELWLQTWLVELFPKARIFTISYDSSAKRTHESGRLDMYCTGENLVHCLTARDVGVGQAGCPVVLIGHCLGGLVLKELCLSAASMLSQKSAERVEVQRVDDLFSNLRGMFFYATPHAGSLLGDELNYTREGALLEELETLKASGARRNQEFDDLKSKHKWRTFGIGEVHKTYVEYLGKKIHVVPEASARAYMDNYYSAPADHYDICKPQEQNESTFVILKDFLKKIQNDGVLSARGIADSMGSGEFCIDLEGRANQVESMLTRPDTNTVVIVGRTGIGKTMLAQQVFQHMSPHFSVARFVSLDTIEAPIRFNSREQVSRKILEAFEGVYRGPGHNLSSVLSQLQGKRVLMIIDNVESEDQLKALQTEMWLQGSASKLIITSTNGLLGTPSNTFRVSDLTFKESRKLFCHCAFKDREVPRDLRDVVSDMIEECENLPLALKVVGGFSGKLDFHDKQLWLDIVHRLQKAQDIHGSHDYRIIAKLRLCYDALLPPEQEIFLDIATLFHGLEFDWVKRLWSGCRDLLAWRNLEQGFLASVDRYGKIWMHKLLRNMGQSIACPPDNSMDKWTRIPQSSCAKKLIEEHQGVVSTRALKLQVKKKEILTIQNTTFINFVHLEYLMLEGVRTSPGMLALPKSLVYLRWKDGVFTSCPVDFKRLEKLAILELIDCKSMKFLPPSVVNASKLTWLELEGCSSLAELPLGLPRGLEHLGVNKTGLRNLPADLGRLKGLRHLQANNTHLTRVPAGLGRLEMLSSLNLRGTRLTTLPDSVGNLKGLMDLNLGETMVTSLPESIGLLHCLEKLNLSTTCLKSLPQSLGDLVNLRFLDCWETQFESLPDAIGALVALNVLRVKSRRLKVWPNTTGMLSQLTQLDVELGPLCKNPAFPLQSGEVECSGQENALAVRDGELQMGIHSFLSQLPLLHEVTDLWLYGDGVPEYWLRPLFLALKHMPSLKRLHLVTFNLVEKIPCELGTLTRLTCLWLWNFQILRELPESLGELSMLETLRLLDLPKLCRLPESLTALPSLSRIDISGCASLESLPRSFRCACAWESESSTSQGRHCRPSDSLRPIAIRIEYGVQCKEMEKVLKAIESGRRIFSREFLTEIGLHFLGDDSGPHGGSRTCSSQFFCRTCFPRQHFCIYCECPNAIHGWMYCWRVGIEGGESDDEKEEEDRAMDMEEEGVFLEEANEWLFIKYLRALWFCLLCSR